MKRHWLNRKTHGLTLVEFVVILGVIAVLFVLATGMDSGIAKIKDRRINCINNLKQIDFACRIWSGDHNGQYPMQASRTNGGAMELTDRPDAWKIFLVMSNELSTPKLLCCPADERGMYAPNFSPGLSATNVSYFLALDAKAGDLQALLAGDDNFVIDGMAVKSGVSNISSNSIVKWDARRHMNSKAHFWNPDRPFGNIGLTGGRIDTVYNSDLTNLFQKTGLATNRLAIP